ncbi:MAG: transposase [bacterium]|nr:transposase [bacterium]
MKQTQKTRRHQQRTQTRQERQQKTWREQKTYRNRTAEEKRNLIFRLQQTITHYFPTLYELLREIPDCRSKQEYELVELLGAGLFLFLFKQGSRNAMNNDRDEPEFRRNYARLFKLRLPHMDTVDDVLAVLDPEHLERLNVTLMQVILAKKTLRPFRRHGEWYRVVIDGTQVMTVQEGHCPHCLHRTPKNGNTQYFHTVVAAKLVCPHGFCLPLASVWLTNPEEYDTQDCELKGWRRLAHKLTQYYPRLPICIVADGLYPNAPCFQVCRENGWAWIVTLKDGNLPTVWSKVILRQGQEPCRSRRQEFVRKGHTIRQTSHWLSGLTYQGILLHWFSCTEVTEHGVTEFVSISSLKVDDHQVITLTDTGRLRWKIENEGFNIQKHHGYGLGHPFSRRSMRAMENYYHLMQIAHLINQLFELSSLCTSIRRSTESMTHLWTLLVGELRGVLDVAAGLAQCADRMQFRYE